MQYQIAAKAIDTVSDERIRRVMRLYYLDGLTWPEVADQVCYCERQCQRLRNEGLHMLGINARQPRYRYSDNALEWLVRELIKAEAQMPKREDKGA